VRILEPPMGDAAKATALASTAGSAAEPLATAAVPVDEPLASFEATGLGGRGSRSAAPWGVVPSGESTRLGIE
jgi:hypothetical protein